MGLSTPYRTSRKSSVRIVRPMPATVCATSVCAAVTSSAVVALVCRHANNSSPVGYRLGEEAVFTVEQFGQGDVVAAWGFGPVPIDAQKQVPAGSAHVVATTKVPSRRDAYRGSISAREVSTTSWMPTAARSQERTPNKATGGCVVGAASTENPSSAFLRPCQQKFVRGEEHRFGRLHGSGEPEQASSSRRVRR